MKIVRAIFEFTFIVFISTILACVFGALHNQISFTVSNEFFKNYLFGNFRTYEWNIKNERILASIVGIFGTYWVGFLMGIAFGIIYIFTNTEQKFKKILPAILITLFFAFFGSIVGFILGKFIPIENSGVFMDFGTNNPQNYVCAALMHRISYYFGLLGLIFGVIYLLKNRKAI